MEIGLVGLGRMGLVQLICLHSRDNCADRPPGASPHQCGGHAIRTVGEGS